MAVYGVKLISPLYVSGIFRYRMHACIVYVMVVVAFPPSFSPSPSPSFCNTVCEWYDTVRQSTHRVESRLGSFVDDIKFMQKTVKKDLGDLNAAER
jgi:hypothetical protein